MNLQDNLSDEEFLSYNGLTRDGLEELVFNRMNQMCERYYNSLPDGVHKHFDGETYVHKTWYDPRTGNAVKSIGKL